jgi:hypothetical protein
VSAFVAAFFSEESSARSSSRVASSSASHAARNSFVPSSDASRSRVRISSSDGGFGAAPLVHCSSRAPVSMLIGSPSMNTCRSASIVYFVPRKR